MCWLDGLIHLNRKAFFYCSHMQCVESIPEYLSFTFSCIALVDAAPVEELLMVEDSFMLLGKASAQDERLLNMTRWIKHQLYSSHVF